MQKQSIASVYGIINDYTFFAAVHYERNGFPAPSRDAAFSKIYCDNKRADHN